MTYALDEFKLPIVTTVADPRFGELAEWLITDVSRDRLTLLGALAMIDDVQRGEEAEPWDSDNFAVTVTSDGFTVANKYFVDSFGQYSLAEVRTALEEYWRFLFQAGDRGLVREFRPDLPEWEADVLLWEQIWKRPHPSHGSLF